MGYVLNGTQQCMADAPFFEDLYDIGTRDQKVTIADLKFRGGLATYESRALKVIVRRYKNNSIILSRLQQLGAAVV
ncbi:hypothetical protein RRG08_046727 [Elysia crispata]|uniref:Uncharacterized protein n=1 Tax=Elysia crispata TaxID=231223 RepID=A0AAE0ZV10_9GAST|nr:hypothetical protein RRG08_046727 [Elysia crispata]